MTCNPTSPPAPAAPPTATSTAPSAAPPATEPPARPPGTAAAAPTNGATGPLVRTERVGSVLLIGVNRPAKRNAWNLATIDAVGRAYSELGDDPQLRVGVVHGVGEHFSAGLDLADVFPAVAADGPAVLAGAGRYDPFALWGAPVPKPVVLAVQGIAFTLSIELALAADVVVAASDVRFAQLEIARGIVPFGGATIRAAAQLGWGNAMRWLLTAEEFGAAEALRIGLVQEVVTPGEQLARALAIAQRIAAQAPLGVGLTLATARTARERGPAAAVAELAAGLPGIVASADAAEGVASFVERRPARFSGR